VKINYTGLVGDVGGANASLVGVGEAKVLALFGDAA
jgi:hypothetical protein